MYTKLNDIRKRRFSQIRTDLINIKIICEICVNLRFKLTHS